MLVNDSILFPLGANHKRHATYLHTLYALFVMSLCRGGIGSAFFCVHTKAVTAS